MYSQLNDFEKALSHFGTRVEVITAMEMDGKLSSEDAYQMIKEERKLLKKVRKKWNKKLQKEKLTREKVLKMNDVKLISVTPDAEKHMDPIVPV